MDKIPLKKILEAVFFVATEPVSIEKIKSLFSEGIVPTEGMIRQAVDALKLDYEGRSVIIRESYSGFKFTICETMSPYVFKMAPEKKIRCTKAMIETLATIAYEQPVTRGDIESVRGVSSGTNTMRALEELDWIRVAGFREVPGRPALYVTTNQFLDDFGLRCIEDLPESQFCLTNPLKDLFSDESI